MSQPHLPTPTTAEHTHSGHQPEGSAPSSDTPTEHHPVGHEGHDMVHDFSNAEHWATVFDDPARDAWQRPDEVIQLLELGPGLVVADLGAGTGYFLGHLGEAVGSDGRVLGLDIEPTLVTYMQERAARQSWTNVEARLVATDDPGLEPQSVDRILIVNTWHHIEERIAYGAKLVTSLKPGGFVMVVDFTLDSAMGPPVEHRLAPEAVLSELHAAGLDASILPENLPEQYVVIGRR